MVALITAVLSGCAVGVLAAAVSDGSVAAELAAGVPVGAIALVVLMRFQRVTWRARGTRTWPRHADGRSRRGPAHGGTS